MKLYQNGVLKKVLLPRMKSGFNDSQVILQKDRALSHAMKSTLSEFCYAHCPEYWGKDLRTLNSSDLHPLDFSDWVYLESKINERSR